MKHTTSTTKAGDDISSELQMAVRNLVRAHKRIVAAAANTTDNDTAAELRFVADLMETARAAMMAFEIRAAGFGGRT
jgi:hypothetical protein